jgi:peptidoglycan LD-endopeptidase CwlK
MLSERSKNNLTGVHPDLVRVIEYAAGLEARFIVTEGMRTIERQKQLLAAGKSRTLRSRHLSGHAVDLVCRKGDHDVSYDEHDMCDLADIVKHAAQKCGVEIEWGGDWKSFCDTPHFQLPEKLYPAEGGHKEAIKEMVAEVPPFTTVTVPEPKPAIQSTTLWAQAAAGVAMASSVVSQAKQTMNDAVGMGLGQLAVHHVNVPMILSVLGLAAVAYTCRERLAKLARGI